MDEVEQVELRDALRLSCYKKWERLAEGERRRSALEGITEEDIQRAVDERRNELR